MSPIMVPAPPMHEAPIRPACGSRATGPIEGRRVAMAVGMGVVPLRGGFPNARLGDALAQDGGAAPDRRTWPVRQGGHGLARRLLSADPAGSRTPKDRCRGRNVHGFWDLGIGRLGASDAPGPVGGVRSPLWKGATTALMMPEKLRAWVVTSRGSRSPPVLGPPFGPWGTPEEVRMAKPSARTPTLPPWPGECGWIGDLRGRSARVRAVDGRGAGR